MTKKLYIETVGCQMNVLDSELVVGSLRRQGYELTHEATDADVIFFNTCSVRQHAEDKIYSALGRLRAHKRRHPDKVLGVLGCMAQKDQELILRRAPHDSSNRGSTRLPISPREARRAHDRSATAGSRIGLGMPTADHGPDHWLAPAAVRVRHRWCPGTAPRDEVRRRGA